MSTDLMRDSKWFGFNRSLIGRTIGRTQVTPEDLLMYMEEKVVPVIELDGIPSVRQLGSY